MIAWKANAQKKNEQEHEKTGTWHNNLTEIHKNMGGKSVNFSYQGTLRTY